MHKLEARTGEGLLAFPHPIRTALARLDRPAIEQTVQVLIDWLDEIEGDPDLEDSYDTEAIDECEPDNEDRGDDFGTNPLPDARKATEHHAARIRATRCLPIYGWNRRITGYEMRREPTVPRAIKRLRRSAVRSGR